MNDSSPLTADGAVRDRIFCAIDTPELARAKTLAAKLPGHIGGLKLGLEFFAAHGPDDVRAVSETMGTQPGAIVEPAYAIRHLPRAIRENRPYLVTHGVNNAAIEARFDALREALDRADP